MIKLKRCPFCGGEAVFQQTSYGTTEHASCMISFEIRCGNCLATAPKAYGHISFNLSGNGNLEAWHDDRPDAAEAWNRRPEDG